MKLNNQIELIDLAVYLPNHKTLIIADTHIGYEEEMISKGILVPKFYFSDMMERIKKIFEKVKVNTIIFNGDIKHEFGTVSYQEWGDTLKLWDFLEKHSKKIIVIKGNHDTILEPIAKKRNIEIKDYHVIDDIFITHGHKEFDIPKNIKTIIIAHEHPAIELKEVGRKEKFKCFLLGKYKRKNLIVMPSLFLLNKGTDILHESAMSPYIKNLNLFKVLVVGDKIYDFGKIKSIKHKFS